MLWVGVALGVVSVLIGVAIGIMLIVMADLRRPSLQEQMRALKEKIDGREEEKYPLRKH